ncbi:MAG: proline dehydrogenase family protein [Bacteroidia bacterium]
MISFDNTEIAFSGKTGRDLNRSYWLFKLVSNPAFVNFGKILTSFSLALHLPIRPAIKATIFRQFVGGEDILECSSTIEELGKYNIGAILDYSVEGAETEAAFDHCTRETLATINKAAGNKHIPFCVFKVTGLGRFALLEKISAHSPLTKEEEEEFFRVKSRVSEICEKAAAHSVPVFIDAEESWIQQAIDDLANTMMAHLNKERPLIYNTFQLYRKDRLSYLKESFRLAADGGYHLGAKLVRGAYMEKERKRAAEMGYPDPIQTGKDATDTDYNAALDFCVEHIDRIGLCAGTHNESSSMHLVQIMDTAKLPASDPRIYYSQLFGMSDHISFNLARAGYNVVKYVPYGPVKEVLPYLIRRAQENTSVKGQTGRELSLIMKEKERRKRK